MKINFLQINLMWCVQGVYENKKTITLQIPIRKDLSKWKDTSFLCKKL